MGVASDRGHCIITIMMINIDIVIIMNMIMMIIIHITKKDMVEMGYAHQIRRNAVSTKLVAEPEHLMTIMMMMMLVMTMTQMIMLVAKLLMMMVMSLMALRIIVMIMEKIMVVVFSKCFD